MSVLICVGSELFDINVYRNWRNHGTLYEQKVQKKLCAVVFVLYYAAL